MEKGGDAHSSLDGARLVFPSDSFFLSFVIGELQRAIEQFSQVNFLANRLFRSRSLTGLKKISATDLYRGNSYGLRDAIHVAFHGEQTLWRSKAAKSTVGRHIGRYGP